MQPRTMVEQAAEAVVAAAARGAFLPGDRLVEAEIARDLGISRVPVREALRLLESQGIVASTPYKGMRLMQVTSRGVAELSRVRAALEALALREIIAAELGRDGLDLARRAADMHERALSHADPAAVVAADVAFHGELCRLSGNAALHALWMGLARQLCVVWGLGQGVRESATIVAEHHALLDRLVEGDAVGAVASLESHIAWHESFDFEAAIEARRRKRR
ncbi:GntR family transcriptional regulator [Falsiroseomonas bella]|uniref:GntR family transcriptional regulator n=1 Tax=Falsiroseomonas bella TaxID=2184016 RepID=A0A317FEH9_9PROT|nr:GntR family transcriptional regulator [Falsiroseomonas bella]